MSGYGYHYGGRINRGDRYGKITSRSSAPKANLGEGHSAKSNNTDFADFKKWYAKLDHDTRSAMDKAADKPDSPFTNEERDSFYLNVDPYHYNQYLQYRYPDKTEFIQDRMKSYYGFRRQLEENGIVPKKPSEVKPETQYAEQMVKNTKEEKATSTDEAESLWNVEYKPHDNSISEPKPAETKADQPTANPEKTVADGMVEKTKPENESKQSENIKPDSTFLSLSGDLAYPHKQFPIKNKDILLDYWWRHHLEPQTLNYLYDSGFLRKNRDGDLVIDPYIDTWAKKKGMHPLAVRDIMAYRTAISIEPDLGSHTDHTSALPSYTELTKKDVYPSEDLIRENSSNPTPFRFYSDDMVKPTDAGNYAPIEGKTQVYPSEPSINSKGAKSSVARDFDEKSYLARDKYNDIDSKIPDTAVVQSKETHAGPYPVPFNRGSWYDLTPIKPDHFDMGPGGYPFLRTGRDPFDFLYLKKDQPSSRGKLTGLGYAGLTGLALAAPYLKQDNTNEQSQTQVPYLMEPEPVNESVPQVQPTLEQQFALQSTSPFDYAKAANLFDLYDRYASPDFIDDSVSDEELIDEAMSEFESPQEPPALGTKIQNSSLASPDADEAPEEINDAMLDAKPGSFWQAARGAVASRANAVKNAAQNVFGKTLARSKAAPKVSNGSASNIQDTSNGPVVLNTPRQRKTNSRVSYQDAAKQMLGASESVNNLAREAYNFNKQQSSQKPEAALAQSLLRAQQESRANRGDTGLQRYRYQSLLNSGLRGMTPDEAIRSGLLTPEQVQVLMRGPY